MPDAALFLVGNSHSARSHKYALIETYEAIAWRWRHGPQLLSATNPHVEVYHTIFISDRLAQTNSGNFELKSCLPSLFFQRIELNKNLDSCVFRFQLARQPAAAQQPRTDQLDTSCLCFHFFFRKVSSYLFGGDWFTVHYGNNFPSRLHVDW